MSSDGANFWGSTGACSPEKILENLDCLVLHFACFHRGESEKDNHRVVKTRSKSPPLDLLKMQHRAQNNSWLVTYPMTGQIKFSSYIPSFWVVKHNKRQVFKRGKLFVY